jgi:NADH-quinone oxidoreductase subunit L
MITVLIFLILGSPLVGSLGSLLLARFGSVGAGAPMVITTLVGFSCALTLWYKNLSGRVQVLSPWIQVGKFSVNLEFFVDHLTIFMLLLITGIGSLIQLYSIGYMKDEAGKGRYFAYLGLFIFFMTVLVTGANLPVVFIGWEGVGLASYLLISFWFSNKSYCFAAEKAFIVNRIGDLGVFVALAAFAVVAHLTKHQLTDLWDFENLRTLVKSVTLSAHNLTGTVGSSVLVSNVGFGEALVGLLTVALLGILFAVTAKSAQIPLFVWLPDAMAGPTPVSALIHAATMVTAGVYLIGRLSFLCSSQPLVMLLMLTVGVLTALMAGLIAMTQRDIKKVLAYSTVSQLGFMVVAASAGLYGIALFHVLTHAFFKACLFLGAGSVIHACDGEQDLGSYGGLWRKLPITALCFCIAAAALAGVAPLSGFYSKYQITHLFVHGPLAHALEHSPELAQWGVSVPRLLNGFDWALTITSCVTAYYILRVVLLTFFGTYRGTAHPHEGGITMVLPVILLSLGSAVAGIVWAGVPDYLKLESLPTAIHFTSLLSYLFLDDPSAVIFKTGVVLVGAAIALFLYFFRGVDALLSGNGPLFIFAPLSRHRFYWDELYSFMWFSPLKAVSGTLHRFWEPFLVDGLINSLWMSAVALGEGVVTLQSGHIRHYAIALFSVLLGLLLFYMVL